MGYISDVRDFFEAKITTWVIILVFSVVFLGTQTFYPEYIDGLPRWVRPIVLIIFMISAVTVLVNLIVSFLKIINRNLSFLRKFLHRRKLISYVKKLDIGELAVVCFFLASAERSLKLDSDNVSVMSLYNKRVLIPYKAFVYTNSTPNYQVNADVWMYISRSSFFDFDRDRLRHVLQRDAEYAELVDYLPQEHPTIRALKNGKERN